MTASEAPPVEGLEILAALRLDDGRAWGEVAVDFQWRAAEAILDRASPPYSYLTRARGSSKTCDLAGIAVAVLEHAPPGAQLYAAAADREQAGLVIREIGGFVRRTPPALWSHAPPAVETHRVVSASGATLVALAADGPSAYGLRPTFLVIDELAQWPTTPSATGLWHALLSSIVKTRGARLVILTTAGSPEHWSFKALTTAKASEMWNVLEVPGPCPWVDPDALEEQRRLLPPSVFERLHLNKWTVSEDRLTDRDTVLSCVAHDGPVPPEPGRDAVVGVDLGLTRDRTAVVVCSRARRRDATVRVDRCDTWNGTRARPVDLVRVEDHVRQVARAYRATVVGDPWQAAGLYQRLRRTRVRVDEFTFTAASWTHLATHLFSLLRDRAIELPSDDDLIDELASVRLVERQPGSYRLDHDPNGHDDRVVALALAAQALRSRPRYRATVSTAADRRLP